MAKGRRPAERATCCFCRVTTIVSDGTTIRLFNVSKRRHAHAYCLLKAEGKAAFDLLETLDDLEGFPALVAYGFDLAHELTVAIEKRRLSPGTDSEKGQTLRQA